jgi:hypothetical protein
MKSPWLNLDTVKKKEKVKRTSNTSKPGPEGRTKTRRPGYHVLIPCVAVEMFQPTCFERGYPGTEKPSKGYGHDFLAAESGPPMKKAGMG